MIQQSLSDNDKNAIVIDLQSLVVNAIISWVSTARFLPDNVGVEFIYGNNTSRDIKVDVKMKFEIISNPLKMG